MKIKKPIPFEFALDALAEASLYTKPMFGCTAVYVGEKIVLVLRERENSPEDNGVWLATTREHHKSLQKDFPQMRSIKVFGTEVTSWQVLPSEDAGFEEAVLKACAFILKGDARIGTIPKTKLSKSKKRKMARGSD